MEDSQISTVSTISYSRTEKYIENFEQKNRRHIYTLSLFYYKIETETHTFQLKHIWDISYKPFSGNNGLLYLHTDQGVFTFQIETNPNEFINAVRKLLGFV